MAPCSVRRLKSSTLLAPDGLGPDVRVRDDVFPARPALIEWELVGTTAATSRRFLAVGEGDFSMGGDHAASHLLEQVGPAGFPNGAHRKLA